MAHRGRMVGILHCLVLVIGYFINGIAGDCTIDPPASVTILETDPPGHVIFSQAGTPWIEWTFNIQSHPSIQTQLTDYFSLVTNDTTVTFSVMKTVDLEAIYEKYNVKLDPVDFLVKCSENGTLKGGTRQIFVAVTPVNEFVPEFRDTPLLRNVSEDADIGHTVIELINHAYDRDVNPSQDEIAKFGIHPYYVPELDGSKHFNMPDVQKGVTAVSLALDFEAMPDNNKFYDLNVSVEDAGGLRSFTTLRLDIHDADDQDPEFFAPGCERDCYTVYTAYITETFAGLLLDVSPGDVQARDRDTTINNTITYTIKGTNPSAYQDYFSQNETTGVVNVTQSFNDTEKTLTEVTLFLEAKEVSAQERASGTTFQVYIMDRIPTTGATPGAVRAAGADNTLMIVLVVLAVVAFILAAAFVVGIVVIKKKFRRKQALVGPDESPTPSERDTSTEDLSDNIGEQWPDKQFNGQRANGLPPLRDTGTGTEELRRSTRRSRRRKKEKDTMEFDGTQEYEGGAEVSFYEQKKQRVKQSSRSKLQMDPKYWITVDNDYPDDTVDH